MQPQRIVRCSACGRPYIARRRGDGTFILSTADGRCRCGSEEFGEFDGVTVDGWASS